MTLGASLSTALAPTVKGLIKDFGQLVELRRQVKDIAEDGTAVVEWRRVGGAELPFPIYAAVTNEQQRRKLWGQEVKADLTAYGLLIHPTEPGDVLRFREGSFAGRAFEVERKMPNDIGGIAELALAEVPLRDDYGF